MRKEILSCILRCVQSINRVAVKCHFIKPIVVIAVDGGICSQMIAYLRGQYYAKIGIPVFYDLRWFEKCGKDNYGQQDRPFELIEAFPHLQIKQLSRYRTAFYQHFMRYHYKENILPDRKCINRSVYLSLYPDFRSKEDFAYLFRTFFSLKTCKQISYDKNTLKGYKICGVHIRRGDMSSWMTIPDAYFLQAIDHVLKKYRRVSFLFFSDEPDWVKEHFVPQLPEIEYRLMKGNAGHVDLLLCAQCDVVIASQGSMGRIASMINPESELIIPSAREDVGFPIMRYREATIFEYF